jgi:hypothetical protein
MKQTIASYTTIDNHYVSLDEVISHFSDNSVGYLHIILGIKILL